ncbi:acyl carrier protein [Actinokineospora sp. 24-640]
MPEVTTVLTEVADLLSQVTDHPAADIAADSRFDALPDWSSYAALRLLTGIEQHFGVRLNLQRYFAIKDVGALAAAITAARAAA